MTVHNTSSALREELARHRAAGRSIGFVPTMGALHAGHASLVRACVAGSDLTVASIFVNPTQFDDRADLESYPVTPREDEWLLKQHGCNLVYRPSLEDVYPQGLDQGGVAGLDFGQLTERMEGAHRPGHFAGVAQVVNRLLTIVQPHTLYLGQKDYQQTAVLRAMIRFLNLEVTTKIVPTVREADGLALSSRNSRLSPDERRAAGSINRQLSAVVGGLLSGWPTRELERMAMEAMQRQSLLQPEYVEVFDGDTLLPYEDGAPVEELVVATAVRVGPVRLIDNRIVP